MPSVKTHFIEVKLSPEDRTISKTYTQLNTDRGKLSFSIDSKYNLIIHFYAERSRTIKFNLLSYYQWKLDNIADLRKGYTDTLAFVYDAVSDFPVKVTVKFLNRQDYVHTSNIIKEAKVRAENNFS